MPAISLDQYGKHGRFLESKGWRIKPYDFGVGTAIVQAETKTIFVKPAAYNQPNRRVRQYVIRHEIWHALHAETFDYECARLRAFRLLDPKSAIEVVAERGCIYQDPSRLMRTWVQASVLWHGRSRRGRYKMSDINSVYALETIQLIESFVNTWAKDAAATSPQTSGSSAGWEPSNSFHVQVSSETTPEQVPQNRN